MSSTLKVNYLFYKNFSRYLQKEQLKHLSGVNYVTRTVLDKIRTEHLYRRDIEICLGFWNRRIISAVLRNSKVPLKVKYKYILKNKCYINCNSTYFIRDFMRSLKNKEKKKVIIKLLKRLNKNFEQDKYLGKNPFLDLNEIISEIETSEMINILVVNYIIVQEIIKPSQGYYYSNIINPNDFIEQIKEETIIENIKKLLKIDIKNGNYIYSSAFLGKMHSFIKEGLTDLSNTFKNIIDYWIKNIIPNIEYSDKNEEVHSLTNLLYNILHLKKDGIFRDSQIESIIKQLNIEEYNIINVVEYLISIIKKGV